MSSAPPRAATLWLPLRRPALAWGAALLATALYALGMARDLSFYDSGELALAAVQLGLSHPPGQPLFTLLGFVFSKLSWWAPLWGLNFLSALCGGFTLLPALSLSERMLDPQSEGGKAPAWVLPLGLLLGSQHAALWEQATRVEVYALAVALALWCLARGAHLLDAGSRSRGAWVGLGVGFGLCAAVNPVLCGFAALAGVPGLAVALRARRIALREPGLALLGGVLGLLPYAYVPMVAGRSDVLVWGAPTSPDALVDYLSGRDFRANLSVPFGLWLKQMVDWLAFAMEFALLPLWGIGLVAHGFVPPRGLTRAAALLSCVLAVAYLARYVRFVPEVPDYVSYTSLASWLCLSGCAALLAWLWARGMRVGALALVGVLLATVLLAPPPLLARTRARDHTARAIAGELLASAPPGAILVIGPDHWIVPLWYLQEVERQRPDVVLVASGLLSSSWYFEHLFRRHPGLARAELRGPGGRLGRLGRLLARNPARPVLFEEPELARGFGLATCVHRFFAAARVGCRSDETERDYAAALWERLRADGAAGEPTALGVLAAVSYERGLLLLAAGDLRAALRTLLAPVEDAPSADLGFAQHAPGALGAPRLPAWRRAAPLGDPARNLYIAAQVAMASGAPKQGIAWMLAARQLGLPEAESWLAAAAGSAAR